MDKKKISIITINYNNKNGLAKTIQSVVTQTYEYVEYIIIDGGSTDGSADIIKNYNEKVTYWVSEPDNGIYQAMNKGVDASHGDYLLFLNSGDCLSSPTVLSEVENQLCDVDIVIGKIRLMPSCHVSLIGVNPSMTMLDFYKSGPVPHPSSFIKRSLFDLYRYDESLAIVADWKLFMQLIVFEDCTYKVIPDIITDFEEQGISSDWQKCIPERTKVISELLPKRIVADYEYYSKYDRWTDNDYSRFYIYLENCRYRGLIYTISVLIVRFLSLFIKSAKFARKFPLFYRK